MSAYRQKLLLIALSVMGLLAIGDRLWKSFYEQPLNAAEKRVEKLNADVQKARQTLKLYKQQKSRLTQLQSAALPSDVEAARTLYQGWLNDLAESIDLKGRRVDSSPPRSYEGYRVLPFSLRCEGTLEQLTSLFFGFYQGPYLHHVRSFTVAPVAGTRQLNMSFSIEAVSMQNIATRSTIPAETPIDLAGTELKDYQDIVRRNVFSASGGVSAAQFTVLTAIVETDGFAEAWFTNALEEEVDKVREGDRLRVSGLDCLVEKITLRDLVLSVDDQRWLLTINDSIADAIALPPEF